MHALRPWLMLLLCTGMSGCSWLLGDEGMFRDRSDDYREAKVEPRLLMPAGMNDSALQDIYVIPPVTEDVQVGGKFQVPRPSPLVAGSSDELVRIQRLGTEEWVLVSVTPGQLWPQVRGFLSNTQQPVARVEAREGLMETGWLDGQEGEMRERYQFRIEQGVQRDTSELHVLQMYEAGDVNSWPEQSADSEQAASMLQAVAQYVANSVESAPVSMIAQQEITASGKVSLQEDMSGSPFIRLELPYHRAWASVERALRESQFEVNDKDRTAGTYYIRYANTEDEDKGWFSDWWVTEEVLEEDEDTGWVGGWLFGEQEASDTESVVLTEQDFTLLVSKETEELASITIQRRDGIPLGRGQATQLLSIIKSNIN
jgi:outer membrane protein assembly factor BamC